MGQAKVEKAGPKTCWCGVGREGEAKAEVKAVGAWPSRGGVVKPCGRGQVCGVWQSSWWRHQSCGGVAKAVGAWPRPWGVAKAVGARPRRWGRGKGRWSAVEAVEAWPKFVGAWPKSWGRSKSRGGGTKAVGGPSPVGRGQGCGGEAKAVGAWTRPWRGQCSWGVAKAMGAGPRPWRRGQGCEAWPRL